LSRIASRVNFPIFAFHETMIGSGATGGVVAKGNDVGIQLVEESLLNLEQGPFSPPRKVSAVSTLLFDGKLLRDKHIPLDKLPPGAEVINPPDDYLELYRTEFIIAASFITLLILMLGILFYFYQLKRKVSRQLVQTNEQLEQRVYERTQSLTDAIRTLHKKEDEITHLMLTDLLTNLPNRRHFEQEAKREFKRSERQHSDLCVAIFDIDHFKEINDDFGHNMGDMVMKRLAQCLNDTLRESDFCARWGGDEFVILFIDSNRQTALKLAERLRQSVESLKFKQLEQGISISLGISQHHAGDSLEQLMHRADQALYEAKSQGRNQISFQN